MSNESFKSTPRTRRFEEIARGVARGEPQAALAFDIFVYAHMLKSRANDNDPGLEMARFDLQAKFEQVMACGEATRNPFFADIARICRRQKIKSGQDVGAVIDVLDEAAAEFAKVNNTVIERSNVMKPRNPSAVRYYETPGTGR